MRRHCERGFTYLGALLLVALMGVALAAVGEAWVTATQREKEEHLLFVGGEFRRAIESYYATSPAGAGTYPTTVEELLLDRRYPGVRRHLRRIYLDPMTGRADWVHILGPQGELMGVYSRHDAKPLRQTGFDTANISFEGANSYTEWRFIYTPSAERRDGAVSEMTRTPPLTGR